MTLFWIVFLPFVSIADVALDPKDFDCDQALKVISRVGKFLPNAKDNHTSPHPVMGKHNTYDVSQNDPIYDIYNWGRRPTVRKLGRGFGGNVYHVIDNTDKEYVVKMYFDDVVAQYDFANLRMLGKLATEKDLGFKVLRPTKLREDTLMMPFTKGRSVKALMDDETVPQEVRKTLSKKYVKALGKLKTALKQRYPNRDFSIEDVHGTPALLSEVESPENNLWPIIIKADGFLVDFDGTGDLPLTLIDPY